jgi:uncharacterized protein (DUF1684 family)
MKTLSKKQLEKITIKTSEQGFVVWIEETSKSGNVVNHWLLDASMIKTDGTVRLPTTDMYDFTAKYKYVDETETVQLVDISKTVRKPRLK